MIGTESLAAAVLKAMAALDLPDIPVRFERPRNRDHGDWSCNVAMQLAREVGKSPRDLAVQLVMALEAQNLPDVDGIEVAGPGFINFRLTKNAVGELVRSIVEAGDLWGQSQAHKGLATNVEFVSANPTGPLHAGHLRGAFLGDAIARLFTATGATVVREYYVNDAGRQMDLFAQSIKARMTGTDLPEDGYRGAYIQDIADHLAAKGVAGDDDHEILEQGYRLMLDTIADTLASAGVTFDEWVSERELHVDGIPNAITELTERGEIYEADGAIWLRTTTHGDDKDRVLVKANGDRTYFAADVAYLRHKMGRGFDHMIYVLGADHHGYIGRLQAIATSWGLQAGAVEVMIAQLVNLLRDGVPVRMSKRAGEILTADEVLEEIGADAARYIYLRTSSDTPLTVDMAEVIRAHKDNPVHYINYSYARIAGIGRKAAEQGFEPMPMDTTDMGLLVEPSATALVAKIAQLPEVVQKAAADRAPHKLARFCEEVADAFHKFYTECQVLGPDAERSSARYWLCEATRITIAQGLGLLGVTPQETM